MAELSLEQMWAANHPFWSGPTPTTAEMRDWYKGYTETLAANKASAAAQPKTSAARDLVKALFTAPAGGEPRTVPSGTPLPGGKEDKRLSAFYSGELNLQPEDFRAAALNTRVDLTPKTAGQARAATTAAAAPGESRKTEAAGAPATKESFDEKLARLAANNVAGPGATTGDHEDAVINSLRTASEFFGGVSGQQHELTAADIAARREAENQRNLEAGAKLGLHWTSDGWKRTEDLAGNVINAQLGRPTGTAGEVPVGTRFGPGQYDVTQSPGTTTPGGGFIGSATPEQVAAARAETAERTKLLAAGAPGSDYLGSAAVTRSLPTDVMKQRLDAINAARVQVNQRFNQGQTGEGY
jgi:hypothetical protein